MLSETKSGVAEKTSFLLFSVILLLQLTSFAQQSFIPAEETESVEGVRTGGDSPLLPLLTWSGNGGIAFDTEVFEGVTDTFGTFTLSNIPITANIVEAYFVVTSWQSTKKEASATFNGVQLPMDTAKATDPDGVYYLSQYRWDVTMHVNGNGDYPFTTFNIDLSYLTYLLVIYENATSPSITVMINDGAESLRNDSTLTIFDSPMSSTSGNLLFVTQASDTVDGPTEFVTFNGDTVLGPGDVFSANLGNYADMHILTDININSGENILLINTGEDWFGVHLAILSTGQIVNGINDYIPQIPTDYALYQNYPNPFNPSTTIYYSIPELSLVTLKVYDVLGSEITTLVNEEKLIGSYEVEFNATTLPSGIYFYKLQAGNFVETKKMVLMK